MKPTMLEAQTPLLSSPALCRWPHSTQDMSSSNHNCSFWHFGQKSNHPSYSPLSSCYYLQPSLAWVAWLAKWRSHSGALIAKESEKPSGYSCRCGCFGRQYFLLLTVKEQQTMKRILKRLGQPRIKDQRYLCIHLHAYLVCGLQSNRTMLQDFRILGALWLLLYFLIQIPFLNLLTLLAMIPYTTTPKW